MAAAAVYGGLKGKLGVEDAPELQLNRIRITLSSKNVKNLEKGIRQPTDPQFLIRSFLVVQLTCLRGWIILWRIMDCCKYLIRIGFYRCYSDLCQAVACSVLTVDYRFVSYLVLWQRSDHVKI
jgi:hypothetical protein